MNFRAQISSTAFYEFWYIEWYSTMMSCYHWWFIILPRFMNFRLIFLPRIINFRLKWVYRVSAFTAFYECTPFDMTGPLKELSKKAFSKSIETDVLELISLLYCATTQLYPMWDCMTVHSELIWLCIYITFVNWA